MANLWQKLLHALTRFRARPVAEQGFRPGSAMGNWGEDQAAAYLADHGCRILGRNIRPKPRLELDIIARDKKGVLLFIEVKTRAQENEYLGRPLDAITLKKRILMRRAALHWLSQEGLLRHRPLYRFDAVEVIGKASTGAPTIRWIQQLDMSAARRPSDDW